MHRVLTYEYSNEEVKPERQAYIVFDLHTHIGAHRVARHGNNAPFATLACVQDSLAFRTFYTVIVIEPRVYHDSRVHEVRAVAGELSKIFARPGHFLRQIPLSLLLPVLLVHRQTLHLRFVRVMVDRLVGVVLQNNATYDTCVCVIASPQVDLYLRLDQMTQRAKSTVSISAARRAVNRTIIGVLSRREARELIELIRREEVATLRDPPDGGLEELVVLQLPMLPHVFLLASILRMITTRRYVH